MYLCIYVADFPAGAMLRLRPVLAGQRVAVLAGEPPLQTVCSVSAPARDAGVRHGMSKAELESFPSLTSLRRSVVEEQSAKDAMMDIASMLTPRIEEHSTPGTCVLVLDISGCERLFGPVEQIAERVSVAVRGLGLEAQIAVSANLPTAVCVARSRAPWEAVTVICPGAEADVLSELPITALALTEKDAETFALWGLKTLGELASLPETEIVVRLGQGGRRLQEMARGNARHLMVPIEPVTALEEVVAFDAPVDGMESVLFVMGPMLDQLIARAANRAMELASVTVTMELDGGAVHARTVKPALPVADRALLLKLLHLDLVQHPPPAGVMTLRLTGVAGGRSKVQIGLFSPQMPEPSRLEVTLARIASLVGEGRVGRPVLLDSHRVESFRMERFEVPAAVHARDMERQPRASACPVALRRMRPPVPVRVHGDTGAIVAFHLQGTRFVVRERFGPWRRSGAWWSGEVWSREEWDVAVESSDGAASMVCVLAHDLLRDRWHMEAIYD